MNESFIILSVAFNMHDSNIAISADNRILASLEVERLFRKKKICTSIHQVELAAIYLLKYVGIKVEEIDVLVVRASCKIKRLSLKS